MRCGADVPERARHIEYPLRDARKGFIRREKLIDSAFLQE